MRFVEIQCLLCGTRRAARVSRKRVSAGSCGECGYVGWSQAGAVPDVELRMLRRRLVTLRQ